jgi:hypothetical protein
LPAIRKVFGAGVILMQYLPFADPAALAVHDAFERAACQLADCM